MATKLQLPHEGEWVEQLIRQIKEAVLETRTVEVAGVEVRYSICAPWPQGMDPGMYDHEGNIYLAEESERSNPAYADLTAFHEYTEIRYKLAGRSHTYAHRRALLEELLAAKRIFDKDALAAYVQSRVNSYPERKIPDRDNIYKRTVELIAVERPLKGRLMEVFTEARM